MTNFLTRPDGLKALWTTARRVRRRYGSWRRGRPPNGRNARAENPRTSAICYAKPESDVKESQGLPVQWNGERVRPPPTDQIVARQTAVAAIMTTVANNRPTFSADSAYA